MNNYETIMVGGACSECGNSQHDGLSCYEQFGCPSAWEYTDSKLYEVHLIELFVEAYDQDWDVSYMLKKNQELAKKISKITNPVSSRNQILERKDWTMTISEIYVDGEANAIMNIKKWKDCIRNEVKNG